MIENLDLVTVVCQGKFLAETVEVLKNYLDVGLQVIYSGWVGEACPVTHENLTVCYSEDLKNPGVGNRNRQIVSSAKGLSKVTTKYAWKVRSDQIYPTESIRQCLDFFFNHKDRDKKIFTPGLYTKEVYHFRDHQSLGKTSEVKRLWSCELDSYEGAVDYNACMRAETYIAVNYLDFYSSTVMGQRLRYREYLLDGAPKRAEALEKSNLIMPQYFVPMPRVELNWPRHAGFHVGGYNYEACAQIYGEYQWEGPK